MLSNTYLDGRPVIDRLNVIGTLQGDQQTQRFISSLLALLGDVRALYVFSSSGTTLIDKSKIQRVLTWSEDVGSFDTPPSRLGSGIQVTFNGTGEEGDSPDSADLSFGDGKGDQPFSVFGLVSPTDSTSSTRLGKYGVSDREWLFSLDGADKPRLALLDESTNGTIIRVGASALAEGAYALVSGTYGGGGGEKSIGVQVNAARVDDSDAGAGTYVAMENGATVMTLGVRAPGALVDFFDGSMALAGVVGKELTVHELWVLKELCNAYFGLSL